MTNTKAVYAASFDPITNGHLWVMNEGRRLFNNFVIAIAINPAKTGKYLFDENERINLAFKSITEPMMVQSIGSRYLVDFAQEERVTHLLRGARNSEDFAVEAKMAEINREMASQRGFSLETVILTPPHDLSIVSSSFVKSLIGYNGWQKEIRRYVPEAVAKAIEEKGTK